MLRKIIGLGMALALASCGTPEFQAERASCVKTWTAKIPPVFQDKLVNRTKTREVPTGRTTCTGTGASVTCIAEMRTEYYTVVEVDTVDINDDRRMVKINACTQEMCTMKYGNASCKA